MRGPAPARDQPADGEETIASRARQFVATTPKFGFDQLVMPADQPPDGGTVIAAARPVTSRLEFGQPGVIHAACSWSSGMPGLLSTAYTAFL
jgi:hypothetical protein